MAKVIKIHKADNVAVAAQKLKKGDKFTVDGEECQAVTDIPAGHKVALCRIGEKEPVIKYGYPIGTASVRVEKGEWVHTHNIKTGLEASVSYRYEPAWSETETEDKAFFMGYEREDGKAGVRNEIWIIPTVGCVNNVATALARQAAPLVRGSIEAVAAFPHPYGCSQMGGDQENTRQILADLVNHPNAGGVLVLGLGCENSNIEELKKYIGAYNEKRVKFLVCQESDDELAEGLVLTEQLAEYASAVKRVRISAEKLIVGLKCGGSDGFSGITANPLAGRFSDMLVGRGGTAILTEVPEMFGAETLLMNRCQNEELFRKTVDMIDGFKHYFRSHHQVIYENPSPGNKAGGISTLEEKSLGCTQKSGSAPVRGVLAYGETVKEKGLNLLSAPGNDLVAATALAAAGAHIVLFTTGRGTPFAAPVPTVKISSNSRIADKKSGWIDFNAGVLTEGENMDVVSGRFFQYVLEVASGRKVRSEESGFHDMAIFKQGVTL